MRTPILATRRMSRSLLTSACLLACCLLADPGAQGADTFGRFAIAYTGPQANADFLGIDSLVVGIPETVPEPSTWMLLSAGSLALLSLRRRRHP